MVGLFHLQLNTKRCTKVVTLSNVNQFEYLFSIRAISVIVTANTILIGQVSGMSEGRVGFLGHLSLGYLSQSGPCHHNLDENIEDTFISREISSARLSTVGV